MDEDIRRWPNGVFDEDDAGLAPDRTGVADLTAGLAIERRLGKEDFDGIAGRGLVQGAIWTNQGHDGGFGGRVFVAEELGLAAGQRGIQLRPAPRRVAESGTSPRCGALGSHRTIEAFLIDGNALLFGKFDREIEREAEGVVEAENLFTRQTAAFPFAKAGSQRLETSHACCQRPPEGLFFVGQYPANRFLALAKVRVLVTEFFDHDLRHLRKEWFIQP